MDHLLCSTTDVKRSGRFDLILLSDLIFNHSQVRFRSLSLPRNQLILASQHDALIETCDRALSLYDPNSSIQPCVLIFYTHHRPHLAHKDMQFFTKATNKGWLCEKIVTRTFPVRLSFVKDAFKYFKWCWLFSKPMFQNDPGEESVRSTVHGWKLIRDPRYNALFLWAFI